MYNEYIYSENSDHKLNIALELSTEFKQYKNYFFVKFPTITSKTQDIHTNSRTIFK